MGFLGSVIADARSSAPALGAASSLAPVADVGSGRLNPAFASGAGNGDAGWDGMGSDGKIVSAAEVSGPHRSAPPVIAAPGGGLEPVSGATGRLPEAVLAAAPLAMKPAEHRTDIDPPGETEVAAVWHESSFRALEGALINSGTSAEPYVDESIPTQPQSGRAIAAPSAGPISAPKTGAYSPLPIGGWEPEPAPPVFEAVNGQADSPAFFARLPERDIPLAAEEMDSRPLSVKMPERIASPTPVAMADPDPEPVARPERRLPSSAEDDAGVKPQSPAAANIIFRPVDKRSPTMPVIADQAVREPLVVKHREVAVQGDDGAAPVVLPEPIRAVIHPPGAGSLTREKAGVARSGAPGPYQGQRSPGSARSAIMPAMPQPAPRAPEVKIGQVDVFIEAPKRSGNAPQSSFPSAHSLASRHYLRRV